MDTNVESSTNYTHPELVMVAETVAREKGIEREEVFDAMEQAIQKAGRSKYGHEHDIRAQIDRKSGEIKLARYLEVAEEIENELTQVTLDAAQQRKPDAVIGEFLVDPLPPIDFGRIAAQTAKQVIVQKVREAERARQFLEFKDRIGEVVNGMVKRIEFGNVIVDLGGRAEGIIRRDETIPREHFSNGDRVRSYIYDVREELRGPQIFLSRSHPQFMAKLFTQEVPEIYDGIIEINSVARDPGSRAKIAVTSADSGSRVQAVVAELQGEKIDIIQHSIDHATFIVNALAPAEVTKVVLDEEANRIEVVVPDDQLSLAIGRRGQNVRLASQLTGWDIDILTEAEESDRRTEEFRTRSQLFIDNLDVDEVIAQLLVTEGFSTIEDVAFVPIEELSGIEGFDEDVANELRDRGRNFLEARDAEMTAQRKASGVTDELAAVAGLTPEMLVVLGEAEIRERDDLADLAADELISADDGVLKEFGLSMDAANEIIMAARAHWFEDEDAVEGDAEAGAEDGAETEADTSAQPEEAKDES